MNEHKIYLQIPTRIKQSYYIANTSEQWEKQLNGSCLCQFFQSIVVRNVTASLMNSGCSVARFACIATRLKSSFTSVRESSKATCNALMASGLKRRSLDHWKRCQDSSGKLRAPNAHIASCRLGNLCFFGASGSLIQQHIQVAAFSSSLNRLPSVLSSGKPSMRLVCEDLFLQKVLMRSVSCSSFCLYWMKCESCK